MAMSIRQIIGLAVSVLVIALIMPMALVYISSIDTIPVVINGTATDLGTVGDPALVTLIQVLLPIVIVVSLIIAFVPSGSAG